MLGSNYLWSGSPKSVLLLPTLSWTIPKTVRWQPQRNYAGGKPCILLYLKEMQILSSCCSFPYHKEYTAKHLSFKCFPISSSKSDQPLRQILISFIVGQDLPLDSAFAMVLLWKSIVYCLSPWEDLCLLYCEAVLVQILKWDVSLCGP